MARSFLRKFNGPYSIIIAGTLAATITMAGFIGTFYHFLHSPLSSDNQTVIYVLTKGTPVKTMVKQMQTQHILKPLQARLFCWWIQIKGAARGLKAGEYEFALNSTPLSLLEKLTSGDVVQYALTFSEGIMFSDLLNLLKWHPAVEQTLIGKSMAEIMALLGEPTLHPEGLFFPDTYYFSHGTTDLEILQRARRTLQERLQTAFDARDESVGVVIKTPYEALILASIIEKEACTDSERPIISGVFQRRLAKKMLLQADPTVIYGIKDRYNGNLTSADLKQDTPYNTYVHKGLPPTPIALPGMKAIFAVMHPDKGEALYFVAKGNGEHHFSATLEEHNQAVVKYQKKG